MDEYGFEADRERSGLADPTLEQFQAWYDAQSVRLQYGIALTVKALKLEGRTTQEACIACYHTVEAARQDARHNDMN